MGLVAGVRWADARQGRRECSYLMKYGHDRGRRHAPLSAIPTAQHSFWDELVPSPVPGIACPAPLAVFCLDRLKPRVTVEGGVRAALPF
jgi:hypothetical protein